MSTRCGVELYCSGPDYHISVLILGVEVAGRRQMKASPGLSDLGGLRCRGMI